MKNRQSDHEPSPVRYPTIQELPEHLERVRRRRYQETLGIMERVTVRDLAQRHADFVSRRAKRNRTLAVSFLIGLCLVGLTMCEDSSRQHQQNQDRMPPPTIRPGGFHGHPIIADSPRATTPPGGPDRRRGHARDFV